MNYWKILHCCTDLVTSAFAGLGIIVFYYNINPSIPAILLYCYGMVFASAIMAQFVVIRRCLNEKTASKAKVKLIKQ